MEQDSLEHRRDLLPLPLNPSGISCHRPARLLAPPGLLVTVFSVTQDLPDVQELITQVRSEKCSLQAAAILGKPPPWSRLCPQTLLLLLFHTQCHLCTIKSSFG